MTHCETDRPFFYHHSSVELIYLIVYVDYIVLTSSDHDHISQMKKHFCNHFQTKDLGKLRYYLRIEVGQTNNGILRSQRKYELDIFGGILVDELKTYWHAHDPNTKLLPNLEEPFSDPEKYRRLVGKLNYLIVTHPDIFFTINVVSQFHNSPCADHLMAYPLAMTKHIQKELEASMQVEAKFFWFRPFRIISSRLGIFRPYIKGYVV